MVKLPKEEVAKMRIKRIEKEIRDTPYHKATEHHIGRLRASLSKLKEKEIETAKKGSGGREGYAVKKQGDATVVLIGPPSVGKSTLLNRLTNAKSKIAPYEFTTVSVIPGMMQYKGAKIQILDVPGLIEGAEEGKGRGREILSVARAADLLIILCDVKNKNIFNSITSSLEKSGIRPNKEPPDVTLEKKVRGGIIIHSNVKQELGKQTIINVAKELGIKNAEINIREKLTMDRLIDAFSKSRLYIPVIFLINKVDLTTDSKRPPPQDAKQLFISAEKDINIDKLRELIWNKLNFLRCYLVRPAEKPNLNHPIIIKKGETLEVVLKKIGEEFSEDKKKAKIWGTGAKYPSQEISLKTEAKEGMQIRFV